MTRTRVAVATAAALLLGGCAGTSQPTPTTSTAVTSRPPSTTGSPSTSQDPDLVSAGSAVVAFWTVVNRLSETPDLSLSELATVARDPAITVWRQLLTDQRRKKQTQVGDVVVADVSPAASGDHYVVKACVDVSKSNLVDSAGKSVVAPNRQPRVSYQYVVRLAADGKFYVTDDTAGASC